jgi:hypothetical protein
LDVSAFNCLRRAASTMLCARQLQSAGSILPSGHDQYFQVQQVSGSAPATRDDVRIITNRLAALIASCTGL